MLVLAVELAERPSSEVRPGLATCRSPGASAFLGHRPSTLTVCWTR